MSNKVNSKLSIRKWFEKNKNTKFSNSVERAEKCSYETGSKLYVCMKKLNRLNNSLLGIASFTQKGSMGVDKTVKKDSKINLANAVNYKDFADQFDVPAQIRDGLKQLGCKVIKDDDFRRALGISFDRWKIAKSKQEFDENRLAIRPNEIIWGSKEALEVIKRKIDVL